MCIRDSINRLLIASPGNPGMRGFSSKQWPVFRAFFYCAARVIGGFCRWYLLLKFESLKFWVAIFPIFLAFGNQEEKQVEILDKICFDKHDPWNVVPWYIRTDHMTICSMPCYCSTVYTSVVPLYHGPRTQTQFEVCVKSLNVWYMWATPLPFPQ